MVLSCEEEWRDDKKPAKAEELCRRISLTRRVSENDF